MDFMLLNNMLTVKMFLEQRYDMDYRWRLAWTDLAHRITPRTATQQEYIEHRADLANARIAELMRIWDLHKPDKR